MRESIRKRAYGVQMYSAGRVAAARMPQMTGTRGTQPAMKMRIESRMMARMNVPVAWISILRC